MTNLSLSFPDAEEDTLDFTGYGPIGIPVKASRHPVRPQASEGRTHKFFVVVACCRPSSKHPLSVVQTVVVACCRPSSECPLSAVWTIVQPILIPVVIALLISKMSTLTRTPNNTYMSMLSRKAAPPGSKNPFLTPCDDPPHLPASFPSFPQVTKTTQHTHRTSTFRQRIPILLG
jgi:hypothetical protein